MKTLIIFAVLGASVATARGDHGTSAPGSFAAAQGELDAFARARPVFEKHCFRCHTAAGAKAKASYLRHLDMDSYPFVSHHGDLTRRIRATLGLLGGEADMPADEPGAVEGEELALVVAWLDAFDHARGGHRLGHGHGLGVPWPVPRDMLIPGRPAPPGTWHAMVNGFGYLQNLGLGPHQIDSGAGRFDGGETDALLTGTWVMGYYRTRGGLIEATAMLSFEPFTVSDGGTPELGQGGEGLIDAQHSHLLFHNLMLGVHPLAPSPCYDLTLFAGQGSATIGPPVYMHRASSPGPTVPRKHHKGENPHETAPVLGASLRYTATTVEASVFGARELGPDDSRLRPWPEAPTSFAARVRHDVHDFAELQASFEQLEHHGRQYSASAYGWRTLRGWRGDALLDWAYDGEHGVLAEAAARAPAGRQLLWTRGEFNQRGGQDWLLGSLGFEHVVAAPRGLRIGLFAEATFIHIPDPATYGRESAITLAGGLHLFGMWGGGAATAGAGGHH